MTAVLQFYDRTTSTVLFDLNDRTGANVGANGYTLTMLGKDPDFGGPAWEFTRFAPAAGDGGVTTFQRAGLRSMSIRVIIKAPSYDGYATAVGNLATLCETGGTLKWIPDGSTSTRYLVVEPSPTPFFIDGREQSLYEAQRLFGLAESGIMLNLITQPFWEGDDLAASENVLTNPTLTRDQDGGGTPDGWAWTSTANISAQLISAVDDAFQFTLAAGTVRDLNQTTGAASASVGQVWTLSADARVTSASMVGNGGTEVEITWQTSVPADISTITSGVVALTTGWQRITVSGTAPATTDRIKARIQEDNVNATSCTTQFRNAKLQLASAATPFSVSAETVALDPASTGLAKIMPIFNPGTAPSPVAFTITPLESTSALVDVWMALRSTIGRNVTDFLNGPFLAQAESSLNGWTVTLGTNVTAVAIGADASGGGSDVARINHVTSPTVYAKKITWTRTTLIDALRGEHDVWVRVKAVGAEVFTMQLRWGPGTGSPPPYTLAEVTHDASAATAFDYVMVNLGRIFIPLDTSVAIGTVKFELWTHTGTADQDLDVDYLAFMPVDQQVLIETPAGATTTWLGKQLSTPVTDPAGGTAGVVSGTQLQFDTTTDNAGTPPAGGAITDAGRHRTTFTIYYDTSLSDTVLLRIRNVTGASNVITKTLTLAGGTNTWTLEWDAVGGNTYQAQVDDPTATLVIYVVSITDTVTPSVAQNEKIRTDPAAASARWAIQKLDSSNNLLVTLVGTGVPFIAQPGYSLLYLEAFDAPLLAYTEGKSTNQRTLTVSPVVTPRYHV